MIFTDYVDQHQHKLLRLATALAADPAQAEDLVQDVLARAFVRWDWIGGLEWPHAYVRKMVVNEYLLWRRRWARVTPRPFVDPGAIGPDHAELHAERAAMVEKLRRLPRKQRVVLALRFYAGMSDLEIADAMNCPPGTVRSCASRALANLRVQLDPTGPDYLPTTTALRELG
jgi:RNA polymerase sigma-70 factor (sigma-E family)